MTTIAIFTMKYGSTARGLIAKLDAKFGIGRLFEGPVGDALREYLVSDIVFDVMLGV